MSWNPQTGQYEERRDDRPHEGRRTETGQSGHRYTNQGYGNTQRRYGQQPQGRPSQGQPTGQQHSKGGQQRGQQSAQVDQGLEFGGEARHGHSGSHVGIQRTYGAPGQEFRQQQAPESSDRRNWRSELREYPMGTGGHEQYGYGHRHGDQPENWPLGRQY